MDFLGIGLTELVAILLIIFLVMGPQDLVKIGATLGRALRKLRQSDTWRTVQDAGKQLRELPETLAREAGIDELKEARNELNKTLKEQKTALEDLDGQLTAWTRTPDPLSQKGKTQEEDGEPENKPTSERS
ncbi:MAG TPA: twin-arginine translocase TatA/TatE family subunit [Anaerolineales bacterium]